MAINNGECRQQFGSGCSIHGEENAWRKPGRHVCNNLAGHGGSHDCLCGASS